MQGIRTMQAADIWPDRGHYENLANPGYNDAAQAEAEVERVHANVQMYQLGSLESSHFLLGFMALLVVGGIYQHKSRK